jgi:PDZ domain
MQTPENRSEPRFDAGGPLVCPNCHSSLPVQMRFCRACGYRLGDGSAEYTETVRLNQATAQQYATASSQTMPGMGPQGPLTATGANQGAPQFSAESGNFDQWRRRRKRRRPHWIFLVLISFFLLSVVGGVAPMIMPNGGFVGRRESRTLRGLGTANGSWVGADGWKNVPEGISLDVVTPPGSAADKAGLVGGDIITSFDGQPVKDKDAFNRILASTPVGKTVDVAYIRDGEAKTTKLTTISSDENQRLEGVANDEEDGFLGIDGLDRVQVEGTNIYGVRVRDAVRNRPAYISGLRDGDIIIEFNGAPIRTVRELGARIDRAKPDSIAKVIIMRGSEKKELQITVGVDD